MNSAKVALVVFLGSVIATEMPLVQQIAAPRTRDGRVSLGPPPGQTGLWMPPNAGDERLVDLDSTTPAASNEFGIDTNPLLRLPRLDGISPEAAARLVGKTHGEPGSVSTMGKSVYMHFAPKISMNHTHVANLPEDRVSS